MLYRNSGHGENMAKITRPCCTSTVNNAHDGDCPRGYRIENAQVGNGFAARYENRLIAVSMTLAGIKQAIQTHKDRSN